MALYFIALLLPDSFQKQIRDIKLEIAKKYEAKHALKLPAHITLQVPFKMDSTNENELVRLLKIFSESNQEFPVILKNFGRFGQKVIFINIEDHTSLIQLHSNLQEELNKFLQFKLGAEFPKIHPHITLATRDLHHKQFPEAWADFKERKFSAQFEANRLCLFKHNGKTWDVFEKFEFDKV